MTFPPGIVVVIVAMLASACAVGGGGTASGAPPSPSGPTTVGSEARLSLSAGVANSGQRAYTFVVEISGGRTDDSSLYCQPTTWDYGDGPALTVTPACTPWTAGMTVPMRFESTHTYAAAGRYVVTFGYGSLAAQTSVDVR